MVFKDDDSRLTTWIKESNTSNRFSDERKYMFPDYFVFCICPCCSFTTINKLSFSKCILILSMYLNALNEEGCKLMYYMHGNKFKVSLLLLIRVWNKDFNHQFQSSQLHNYKYLNSRPIFLFILQKPLILLKEGNRFWEEGVPYGKQVQEKSICRIKHMEKCLYGIKQVSLMEVIFGLSWLLFICLTSNSLHLILYQCWRERKKGIKMKL